MSKKQVLELINMDEQELAEWLDVVGVEEFRNMLRIALKEQDRDTRHACAEAIDEYEAMATIMYCRGGLPEGL